MAELTDERAAVQREIWAAPKHQGHGRVHEPGLEAVRTRRVARESSTASMTAAAERAADAIASCGVLRH